MPINKSLEDTIKKAVEDFNQAAINTKWFTPEPLNRDINNLRKCWDTEKGREVTEEINNIYIEAYKASIDMALACANMRKNQLMYSSYESERIDIQA